MVTLVCQIWYDYRIGIMKIHDTLSHGDKPMCQIWYNNVKVKKNSHGPNTNLHKQTDGQTDRRTNGWRK